VIQLKTSLSFIWGKEDNIAKGEKYCNNLITLSPKIATGYCIYTFCLHRQKKYEETIQMANQALEAPGTAEKDHITGLLEATISSMVELDWPEIKISAFLKKMVQIYPQFTAETTKYGSEVQKKKLWKEGKAWLHSPNKDLVLGESLFQQIILIDPTDFWATLLFGGCLSWNKKLVEGEAIIKKALELNDTVPHGYALLAQNQFWQEKHTSVLTVVTQMMSKKFPSVEVDNDHKEKIFEALDCLKQVCGLNSSEFKSVINQAKIHYPTLVEQLTQFEKAGNNQNCCVS